MDSDGNYVRVWRPNDEHFNPAFGLQRQTAPTHGVIVWGAIPYDTRLPLMLIDDTLLSQRHVQDILEPHVFPFIVVIPADIFNRIMLVHTQHTGMPPPLHHLTLALPTILPI